MEIRILAWNVCVILWAEKEDQRKLGGRKSTCRLIPFGRNKQAGVKEGHFKPREWCLTVERSSLVGSGLRAALKLKKESGEGPQEVEPTNHVQDEKGRGETQNRGSHDPTAK